MVARVACAQVMLPEHRLLRAKLSAPVSPQTISQSAERRNGFRASPPRMLLAETYERLPDFVPPLLPDQWDQDGPLRGMTPLINGEHAAVGCVALAMAQVMHKWQHPAWGTGSLTYNDSLGCGKVLTADFFKHQYDWQNMLDKYVEGEYTQQQADAVALLGLDCGISVQMKYGTSSGAYPVRQAIALPTYFGYDEGAQLYFRDFYTKEEITLMLKRELAAGRPVLASGYNYIGGHAFVIDGYNQDDWFHINVGNPDAPFDGDGWTPLDCMAMNMPQWYDVDSPESGLNLLQVFVTGVLPATHPEATHRETHVIAMQRIEAITTEAARTDSLKVCIHDLANMGRSLLSDSISIMLMHDETPVCPLYTYNRTLLLEEVDDTTYTDTVSIAIPKNLVAGAYTLRPMYKDGNTWQSVRTCTGTPNYLFVDIADRTVCLSSDTARTAYLTLEDFDIPDLIVNGTAPEISLTLRAHNAEISGRIYLYMEPLDEKGQEFYLISQGVAMQAGEISLRHFHKTRIYAPKTGRYRLHFLYDSNLFGEDKIELTSETIDISVLHEPVFQLANR